MVFPAPRASLYSKDPLPTQVDQINAQWLSECLGRNVQDVKIVKVLHGTASKILIELSYGPNEDPEPKRLCIKGGFNLKQRDFALDGIYRREVEFFSYIAPIVDMRIPRAWFAGSDVVTGQGIILLEDLTASNCTFGECTQAWSVELVREALEDLASLHAKTWGADPSEFEFLQRSEDADLITVLEVMMSPKEWDNRFIGDARPPVDDSLVDRERMLAAFRAMWRTRDRKFRCLIHGDPHIGNTYITADGRPGFVDFQCVLPGSAMHDVAYFIAGALEIEDRRKHEIELLQSYLTNLHDAGGPLFTVEEVWEEYRKHHLHGFGWPLSGPMMQPKEKVDAMSARHSAAIIDHKSLELYEAMPEYVI